MSAVVSAEEIDDSDRAVKELDKVVIEGEAKGNENEHRKTFVTGRKLHARARSNLGATLENEMGVSNASFGPSVGIPVIRGLTGSRIQVAQDGLANHDASSLSPDHAITTEPLLVESIRIEKGPSAIRYGGTALGGVVDVIDNRVPEYAEDELLSLSGEYRYGTNPQEHVGLFKLDSVIADHFAFHVDGLKRSRGIVKIPGLAIDEDAILEQFGLDAEGNTLGFIANSDSETKTGAVGFSLVDDQYGFIGASASIYDTNYGIPPGGHPSHSHGNTSSATEEEEGENVRIDMHNVRYNFKGELFTNLPVVEAVRLNSAIVDYEHDELDGDRLSTHFTNFTREIRFEADHKLGDYLNGTAGVQFSSQDFAATGEEDFIPETKINQQAGYWIQRLTWADLAFEGGIRSEHQQTKPQESTRVIGGVVSVTLPELLKYNALSLSFSALYNITEHASIALHWQGAQRPPAVQELLSLGPHLATRSFDVGNIELELEKADAWELTFNWQSDHFSARINLFKNDIDDYIYQENLGFFYDIEEQLFRLQCVRLNQCVPVLGYRQQDARFLGYEAETSGSFDIWYNTRLTLGLFSDYTRGYFRAEGAGDVPRLPPRRAGIYLTAEHGNWHGGIRWTHAWEQNRPGLNETATDSYELLNANLEIHPFHWSKSDVRLFFIARNLLNEEIRHSVSFLRSFAPEAGRSFEMGISLIY